MDSPRHRPLQVGDYVRLTGSSSNSGPGLIITILKDDYVQVRWSGLPAATTHRALSLTLVAAELPQDSGETVQIRGLSDLDLLLGE